MHLAVRLVFVLTALFVSACGDSPTAPTQRTLQVAGTYAGPIVFRVDGRAILSGSAEVQVEQSGSRLTITGVLSVGGRTGTLPRITGTLDSSGRLTNTSGGGVSDGVDATCGRITVTSSVATFTLNTLRYTETARTTSCGTLNLSGTLTRGARLTPTTPTRPVDQRFNDAFWRQIIFNKYDYPGEGYGSYVLDASVMRLYIATTTPGGRRVLFGGGLAQMIEEGPKYGRQLSGRNLIGRSRTGTYQEVERHRARNEPGWITILPQTNLSSDICGNAQLGANPGEINLNANNQVCLDLEVFAHELGHALGLAHVDPRLYPRAVMKPGGWRHNSGQYRFTATEKYHARLAYEVGRGATYCGWPFQAHCARGGSSLRGLARAPIVID